MEKLSKEQALAVMGYTGIATINFSSFHEDVEKRIGRPVFTHEFGSKDFFDEIKALYRDDFLSLCVEG